MNSASLQLQRLFPALTAATAPPLHIPFPFLPQPTTRPKNNFNRVVLVGVLAATGTPGGWSSSTPLRWSSIRWNFFLASISVILPLMSRSPITWSILRTWSSMSSKRGTLSKEQLTEVLQFLQCSLRISSFLFSARSSQVPPSEMRSTNLSKRTLFLYIFSRSAWQKGLHSLCSSQSGMVRVMQGQDLKTLPFSGAKVSLMVSAWRRVGSEILILLPIFFNSLQTSYLCSYVTDATARTLRMRDDIKEKMK